jgi:hypothetical protein
MEGTGRKSRVGAPLGNANALKKGVRSRRIRKMVEKALQDEQGRGLINTMLILYGDGHGVSTL